MPAPPGRGKAGKILQKASNQTRAYYAGWKKSDEQLEKKDDLYGRAIDSLVYNIKKRKVAENKPPKIQEVVREVIKDVPFEVIRKVIKEVPIEVEVEVIKEVPVEVPVEVEIIKEIRVEVPKLIEVIKEVPKEIIKEVKVPFEVEVIREVEVPIEVIKEVEVVKEVAVPYPVDNPETIKKLNENFTTKLKVERLSKKALEKRLGIALIQARLKRVEIIDTYSKQYKRLATYAYILTLYSLPQILRILL